MSILHVTGSPFRDPYCPEHTPTSAVFGLCPRVFITTSSDIPVSRLRLFLPQSMSCDQASAVGSKAASVAAKITFRMVMILGIAPSGAPRLPNAYPTKAARLQARPYCLLAHRHHSAVERHRLVESLQQRRQPRHAV